MPYICISHIGQDSVYCKPMNHRQDRRVYTTYLCITNTIGQYILSIFVSQIVQDIVYCIIYTNRIEQCTLYIYASNIGQVSVYCKPMNHRQDKTVYTVYLITNRIGQCFLQYTDRIWHFMLDIYVSQIGQSSVYYCQNPT